MTFGASSAHGPVLYWPRPQQIRTGDERPVRMQIQMDGFPTPAPAVTPDAQALRSFAWNGDGLRTHDRSMDTEPALAPPAAHSAGSALPAPPGMPPVSHWQRLLPEAISLAWRNDPEVMSRLLGTVLAAHLQLHEQRMQSTLDELHLMISMELQALAGYPD